MNDERLDDELRALPRHEPDGDFATRVIAAGKRRRRRWRAAMFSAAAVVVLLAVTLAERSGPGRLPDTADFRALREEHRNIAEELARLRHDRAETLSAVSLTGDERVEIVLPVLQLAGGVGTRGGGGP